MTEKLIPADLSDIKVALARIEGQTIALQKADETAQANADHRHRNLLQAIETFVPRRELEIEFRKCEERAAGLGKRLDDLEGDRKRVTWAIFSSSATAIGSVVILVLKKVGMF